MITTLNTVGEASDGPQYPDLPQVWVLQVCDWSVVVTWPENWPLIGQVSLIWVFQEAGGEVAKVRSSQHSSSSRTEVTPTKFYFNLKFSLPFPGISSWTTTGSWIPWRHPASPSSMSLRLEIRTCGEPREIQTGKRNKDQDYEESHYKGQRSHWFRFQTFLFFVWPSVPKVTAGWRWWNL